MAKQRRELRKKGPPPGKIETDERAGAAYGLTPEEIVLPEHGRAEAKPAEVEEQPIASCGPVPARRSAKVEIFSFRQHDELGVAPIKGTPEGIAKYMMATPIEGTGEEVEASLLDDQGFNRSKSEAKPSAATS
jgi:hypothetical protein